MKVYRLICSALALTVAATSVTPALAAPILLQDNAYSTQMQPQTVQFDSATRPRNDDDTLRPRGERNVQRRGGEERPMRRGDQQPDRNLDPNLRDRRQPSPEMRVERRNDENRIIRRRDDDRRGPPPRMEQRGLSNNYATRRYDDRRGPPPRFERRRDGNTYFNGHRGYREKRRGYEYYNGFWFPPAAFALGMILGTMNQGPGPGAWEDHVDWCYDRYGNRYRERDNTYMARDGYRRKCISPYS